MWLVCWSRAGLSGSIIGGELRNLVNFNIVAGRTMTRRAGLMMSADSMKGGEDAISITRVRRFISIMSKPLMGPDATELRIEREWLL